MLIAVGSCVAFLAQVKDAWLPGVQEIHETYNTQETYFVTFLSGTTRVETQTVEAGGSAIPPRKIPTEEGFVFRAWSIPFTNVRSDILVRAELLDINNMKNVFSLTSVYAQQGGEVKVPLRLEGNADLCAFDISLAYPKEELAFIGFEELDGDVVANSSDADGAIYLNFARPENIHGGFDICFLVFAKKTFSDVTEMPIVFSRVDAISAQGDELLPTKYNTVDANVFFY